MYFSRDIHSQLQFVVIKEYVVQNATYVVNPSVSKHFSTCVLLPAVYICNFLVYDYSCSLCWMMLGFESLHHNRTIGARLHVKWKQMTDRKHLLSFFWELSQLVVQLIILCRAVLRIDMNNIRLSKLYVGCHPFHIFVFCILFLL